jgi:NTE family protein
MALFTWGVLDRALEEPRMQLEGISGTSAGAMNAAVLADGYAAGGADGAREALEKFWRKVSDAARFSPFQRGPLDVLMGRWTLDASPVYVAMDLASRLFSPYDLGIAALNPLADILSAHIDFDRLQASPIKVFVTATNVRSGRGRVFRNAELTPEVSARVRLPAHDVPGDRDRRRPLLGRRLLGQSDDHAAGARMQFQRHGPGADQSGRAAGNAAFSA